jgi:putative endonuclease
LPLSALVSRVTAPFDKSHQGNIYETRACDFLESKGLSLVERNWRCRQGEIDLIMRDGATLVFVEVRKRSTQQFGGAGASISNSKLKKVEAAAAFYLANFARAPDCRIDAVIFDIAAASTQPTRPEWIKNILQR